jgi:hypothetical protein
MGEEMQEEGHRYMLSKCHTLKFQFYAVNTFSNTLVHLLIFFQDFFHIFLVFILNFF